MSVKRATEDLADGLVKFVTLSATDISLTIDKVTLKSRQVPGVRVQYSCFDRSTPHSGEFVPDVYLDKRKYKVAKWAGINALPQIAKKTGTIPTIKDNLGKEYEEGF